MTRSGALGPVAALTAAGLAGAAGVHVAWALGSPWPFRDRETWRRSVLDARMSEPGPLACVAVAGALGAGAGSVLAAGGARVPGWASLPRPLHTLAPWGVAGVLAARGGLGLVVVRDGRAGGDFSRLDRRVYSPLCLALATGAAWTAARRRDQPR